MSSLPKLALSAALVLLAGPAFGQQTGSPQGSTASGMSGMTSSVSPADKALMNSMTKMNQGMNVRPTGDSDRDFVTMMIPHHQGAIDMAKVELQYGKDPAMRKLARTIIAAQEREIAEMKRWLAQPHP